MLNPDTPYTIIAVVAPETDDPATSGKITNYPCAPTISHEPLMRTRDGYALRPEFSSQGYVLLVDLFRREGDEAGAAAYAKCFADAAAGKRVVPFPQSRLPREVLRRRDCEAATIAAGKRIVDGEEGRSDQPAVEADKAERPRKPRP